MVRASVLRCCRKLQQGDGVRSLKRWHSNQNFTELKQSAIQIILHRGNKQNKGFKRSMPDLFEEKPRGQHGWHGINRPSRVQKIMGLLWLWLFSSVTWRASGGSLRTEVIGFTLVGRRVYGKARALSGRPVESYYFTQRRGHRTFRSVGADAVRRGQILEIIWKERQQDSAKLVSSVELWTKMCSV